MIRILTGGLLAGLLAACGGAPEVAPGEGADAAGHMPPTAQTIAHHAAEFAALPHEREADFADARRGLIAAAGPLAVAGEGGMVWDLSRYDFITGEAPASVHPGLWQQARLNNITGLFRVADGVYQLRGFDLANMTLIAGETGWIVVDPLTTAETAAAAWRFAMQHLEEKPIRALLFTHSHVDHFGGVNGLLTPEAARAGEVRVIAPANFTEEATSENVLAGVAMQRRAGYQYGRHLARSPRGHVDLGVGKDVPFEGRVGFLEPTETIDTTGQRLRVDGVEFVFQHVPESEAPANMTFYLPASRVYCGADLLLRSLHNFYTLRGAKVRDAMRWSGYIHDSLRLFPDTEIFIGGHGWPVFGRERVTAFLKAQRDAYKYIHDQTLRLANHGHTPREIAEELTLPEALARDFDVRGYYGTVSHNAKAVYQHYFGWYDGNPAKLDPLPPAAAATRYVAAMGGSDAVLARAEEAFADGDYRWAAELLNHLVFATPDSAPARALLARVYDQLGYRAESALWRDVYLSGAQELRYGGPEQGVDLARTVDLLRAIPPAKFFQSMAVRLSGPKAAGVELAVNFIFSDRGEGYHLWLENAVLHSEPHTGQAADATLTLSHEMFLRLLMREAGLKELLLSDELALSGSRLALLRFLRLFDRPDGRFPIVTPLRRAR